jgi:homopolymeric O-antigen transport system permease protein
VNVANPSPSPRSEPRPQPLLVIEPGRWPLGPYLRDTLYHRGMIGVMAMRDIKLRYRQTVLGVAWVVLGPLVSAGILSFVFGRVAKLPTDGVPSFLFTFAGLLTFNVFTSTTSKATGAMIGNAALVSKIFFPRLILPLAGGISVLIDFAVSLIIVAFLVLTNDVNTGWAVLLLPVWVLALFVLAQGLGCGFGAVSVRYRDVPQVVPVLLQLALYASPVAYAVSAVPQKYQWIYYLNPLVALIEGGRWSMLGTTAPTIGHVAYAMTVAIVVFVVGVVMLEKMERKFADVI